MEDIFSRTELLIGSQGLDRLRSSCVAVFGVGGVGSYVCEALARSGVGKIILIDSDRVAISNINRQIIALNSTVGAFKTHAMRDRIADINPDCSVICHNLFFSEQTMDSVDLGGVDYIADAIDSVTSKLLLIQTADRLGIPIMSSMGAGNKLHPELFEIADIYKTSVCPLARVMRRELKKRNINKLKVVYSKEEPAVRFDDNKRLPASISFVPSAAGLIMAGEIIRDICGL